MEEMLYKICRSDKNRIIFGVCGGIGKYYSLHPIFFRFVFFVMALHGGIGVLVYLYLALAVPLEKKGDSQDNSQDDKKRYDNVIREIVPRFVCLIKEVKPRIIKKFSPEFIFNLVLVLLGFGSFTSLFFSFNQKNLFIIFFIFWFVYGLLIFWLLLNSISL